MHTNQLPFKEYSLVHEGLIQRKFNLPEPLLLEQWLVPTGTEIVLTTTRKLRVVILPQSAKDERGFTLLLMSLPNPEEQQMNFAFISRHEPTQGQIELAAVQNITLVPVGDMDAFTVNPKRYTI